MAQDQIEFSMRIEDIFHLSNGVSIVVGIPLLPVPLVIGGAGEIYVEDVLRWKGRVHAEQIPSPRRTEGKAIALVGDVPLTSMEAANSRCEFHYFPAPETRKL